MKTEDSTRLIPKTDIEKIPIQSHTPPTAATIISKIRLNVILLIV
jgi:hypothetical protein